MNEKLVEVVARAMFESQVGRPNWDALKSWVGTTANDQVPGRLS